MTTISQKIEAVRMEFDRQSKKITAFQLAAYPDGSLGQQLGTFLLGSNYGQNVYACREDVYQLLIARNASVKEDIAIQFYLFGNGCNSGRTWLTMALGMVLFPFAARYFLSRCKEGKTALRFYDVDHFRMLHLPVERVKDAFMIR